MSTNVSNQIFVWQRFTAALRKEVVENKRQLLLVLLSMFLAFTVIMVIGNVLFSKLLGEQASSIIMDYMPAAVITTAYSIVVAVAASLAFRNLTSKTGRIALFTNPASNTEKFIVNLLVYVIGAGVAFFACAQLADLARIAVLTPFKSPTFAVAGPMNFFKILMDSSYNLMNMGNSLGATNIVMETPSFYRTLTLLSLLLGPAIYFLGSVLWPRWSLVKSFASQQLINFVINIFVFIILFGTLYTAFVDFDANSVPRDQMSVLSHYTVISSYIAFGLCIVWWVLSWFLFKRKDIISLKWWS